MLARPDQRQLLIRNTPLYVQLHIGIYLIDKVIRITSMTRTDLC